MGNNKSTKGIVSIHGKDNYFVDREGNIYSNLATGTRAKKTMNTLRKLKPVLGQGGYLQVSLGRNDIRYIHNIVLEAFGFSRPEKADGCHKDNDKTNNHINNLYWGSRFQNVQDAVRDGRHIKGETSGHAKLTEEQVRWLLKIKKTNELRVKTMSMILHVHENTVRDILKGRTWKHVR